MTMQQASRLLLACTWLSLATLIVATLPHPAHEARQGPVSTDFSDVFTTGPGPVSLPSSTTPDSTTTSPTSMSPTPSSEPASSSTSPLPLPLFTSFYTPLPNTPVTSATPTSSTPSTPSTSSAAPEPSSSPSTLVLTIQNLTTCTSASISWQYSGTDAGLLLSVTNIGVPQYDDAKPRAKRLFDATVQQQLANTKTSVTPWPWQTVNLTQGWYEIQGLVLTEPTVFNSSSPFFVSQGPDISCLTVSKSSSSVLPSATSVPSPSTNSKSTVNAGGIAGGVIGGIAVLVLAILVGLYLSRRRKASVRRRLSKPRQYGSLKSTTSSIQPGDGRSPLPGNHFHSHSDSTGAILQDVAGGNRRMSATTTPSGSDEHVTPVDEEKLVSPASYSGMSPFDALSTPLRHDHRASTNSDQTPTAVASESFRSRVPSSQASIQTLEQQAQRIRSSNGYPSDRLSMPTLPSPTLAHLSTSLQSKEEYPLTLMAPTPVNRSISAGAVSTIVRRASRKPVPHYSPSILFEDKNMDSVSTNTAGAESSQSHGTGVHGTPSDLAQKASLRDGRPMHLLIPDMPLPQPD